MATVELRLKKRKQLPSAKTIDVFQSEDRLVWWLQFEQYSIHYPDLKYLQSDVACVTAYDIRLDDRFRLARCRFKDRHRSPYPVIAIHEGNMHIFARGTESISNLAHTWERYLNGEFDQIIAAATKLKL